MKWTKKHVDYLREIAPGRPYKEITSLMNEHFGEVFTFGQIKGLLATNNITNGNDCRFRPGHVSFNKGRKGYCAPGSERGWFKAGHCPSNHKPVGTIIERTDGRTKKTERKRKWIKVAEPNKWVLLSRYVYEEAYGPVPKGKKVLHLNGDSLDCKLENLVLVSSRELMQINKDGLVSNDIEIGKAAVNVAKLEISVQDKRNKRKG